MEVGRRTFMKGLIAAGSILAGIKSIKSMPSIFSLVENQIQGQEKIKMVHTLCLGCNVRCGIRVCVDAATERILKAEGNPYHPNNTGWEPIPYDTPVKESLKHVGPICLKGQNFVVDHVYDPFRIRVPLKRMGPRGSMKWKPIDWEQLITEVVDGGDLFGEGYVEGFRDIRNFEVAANPEVLDKEFAVKANQVVLLRGRGQPGRIEFLRDRWLSLLGSPNFIAHDAVCANGVQTAHKYMTLIGAGKYEGQDRVVTSDDYVDQMRVDLKHAKFIIAFGDPYSAGQPAITPAGRILARRIAENELKLVHVAPEAGNVFVNATKWIPIKPGTDGALLMGMIRWIIENERYNKIFLENTHEKAAKNDGETAWTNATHLVIMDENHPHDRKCLRDTDLGLGTAGKYVVIEKGTTEAKVFDTVEHGELFYDGYVTNAVTGAKIKVKSSLSLLKEKAFEKTLEEWAEVCGISVEDIKWLASEFTGYGKSAGILVYRVFGSQPNGVYAIMALVSLHMLIGNINWKGGYLKTADFPWTRGIYDLTSFPGKVTPKKAKISREGFKYEDTLEYANKSAEQKYPARKPWFPKSYGGLWTEVFESMRDKYPYACKILITYFGNPIYVLPGGHRYIDVLKDRDKVPLHIAIDTTISETSMYADYIVPDVTGVEGSYGIMNPYPPNLARWVGVRVPAIEPLTQKTSDGRPICAETFAIDTLKKLGLTESLKIKKPDGTFTNPIGRAEDYYLRAIVNLAKNAEICVKPTDEDIAFVEENYPVSFVSYAKSILSSEEWKKVCFIIGRGGVFESIEAGFHPRGIHKYGKNNMFKFWVEDFGTLKNSLTGKKFWGTAQYIPIQTMKGLLLDELDAAYKYTLISYKAPFHTQSRTIAYRWALEVLPENTVEISEEDADREELETGDLVKVISASHPEGVVGRVQVTKRLRPGVIAIMFHYGHWAHGSEDYEVDGRVFKGDLKRRKGIWVNKLARVDPDTKAPVVDPISGASTTGSYRVNLVKI
ncbi:molybdopterin-dependent oxidoreductase [Candidatus Bathyarchaeota archaeon]|nr:molybdopterin-dependent oxidoreductase [Candidatus Bathyarchaeota archaeon]